MINTDTLDNILKKTVDAVEKSKEEVYLIGETARQECFRIEKELIRLKLELATVINGVDTVIRQYNWSRTMLMEVNRDFQKYSEKEIKDAYDQAYQKQIELLNLQEKEKLLRLQRDHLERNLSNLKNTTKMSEGLISNIGLALKFLTNDMEIFTNQIGELQKVQGLGISIIKAQEEERRRLAREIHDGPAQTMANIVLCSELCMKFLDKDPELVRPELTNLMQQVRFSLQDVRKIIFNLRPMALDDLGLIPALKRYLEKYIEENKIDVKLTIFGKDRRIHSFLEVALFRLIQESLTNIYKHANASQATIKIEFLPLKINVIIKDNGKGFNLHCLKNDEPEKGYGIIGMNERIQLLKGKFQISTSPGNGTEIIATLPFLENNSPFK